MDSTDQLLARLDELRITLDKARPTTIGFPTAVDVDFSPVLPLFAYVLNNVGDPFVDSVWPAHSKPFERELVEFFADLLGAPAQDRWGYVTSGGTDGNHYGLYLARGLHPRGLVYYSEAAHYSVPKIIDLLRMDAVRVRASTAGELDYHDLRQELARHRDRPAIVLATAGTTMTEAVDCVRAIRAALAELAVGESYVHVDAALAGVPLALLGRDERPGMDFVDGADSIAISGHKFLGSPLPCGVLLTRRTLRDRVGRPVDYVGTLDSTIGGSRSGHAPLLLWWAVRHLGLAGLRRRAVAARAVAAYAVSALTAAGVPAWRNPHACTVVLPTPPPTVTARWRLASSAGRSHIVCVPGVTREQIDAFVTDLLAAAPPVTP